MILTTQQKQLLKTTIQGDPALNGLFGTSGNAAQAIADAMNLPASPAFTVWKTNVEIRDVGDNIVGTDLAGLSTLNNTRLQTAVILGGGGVNASLADRRAFFDDIFSGAGGSATRAKLLTLWKRLATRAEKLFATGAGSDAVPATMSAAEGLLTVENVDQAMAS